MVEPSQFYKFIRSETGYQLLVNKKIMPDTLKFEIFYLSPNINLIDLNSSNMSATKYGKMIELHYISYLKGESQDILTDLPNTNINGFIKLCTNNGKNTRLETSIKNEIKFDLLLGDHLIDFKTSKKTSFTNSDLHSYFLQLGIYFARFDLDKRKTIEFLAIYNPINNLLIRCPTKLIDGDSLLEIYNKSDKFLVDCLDKRLSLHLENYSDPELGDMLISASKNGNQNILKILINNHLFDPKTLETTLLSVKDIQILELVCSRISKVNFRILRKMKKNKEFYEYLCTKYRVSKFQQCFIL